MLYSEEGGQLISEGSGVRLCPGSFAAFEASGGPLWTRTRDPSLIRTVL
jgi:hypothetical protein